MNLKFAHIPIVALAAAGLAAPAAGQCAVIDDGTQENALGLTTGGVIWGAVSYTSASDCEEISFVQVAWGPSSGEGQIFIANDPNNDGDPTDITAGDILVCIDVPILTPDDDTFDTYLLPSTVDVSGTYFVGFGADHVEGQFPLGMDETNPIASRSWLGLAPTNICNPFATTTPANQDFIENFGFPANLMIRAGTGCPDTICPWDVESTPDGNVGTADLLALLGGWGTNGPGACLADPADVTGTSDLLELLGNWGPCPIENDNCEVGALPLEIDGPAVQVDMSDNEDDTVAATGGNCDGTFVAGEWFSVIGDGTTLTVTTCDDSDPFNDLALAVICQGCDGTCVTTNLDGSGNCGLNARASFCSLDGTEYLILLYQQSGTPGSASIAVESNGIACETDLCVPQETCDDVGGGCEIEDPATCQLPNQGPNGGGVSGATSDTEAGGGTGFAVADNMTIGGTGVVENVCVWGSYFAFPGDCGEGEPGYVDDFTVTFYNDENGVPGSVITSYNFAGADAGTCFTGNLITSAAGATRQEYVHSFDLSPALTVAPGTCVWMEVQNSSDDGTCFWLWSTSPDGDGLSIQDGPPLPDGQYDPTELGEYDLAWCIDQPVSFDTDCFSALGGCCFSDGTCNEDVTPGDCQAAGGVFNTDGCGTCPEFADYQYDDFVTENSLGGPGGDIAWIHRFDAEGGADTITEILTTFQSGVSSGDTVGWAILNDDGNNSDPATSTVLAQGTTTAEAGSIETDDPQSINVGSVAVSGSFYVAVWVTYPEDNFPAPIDTSTPDPSGADVWFVGVAAGAFDPADLSGATLLSDVISGVWLLRANGN